MNRRHFIRSAGGILVAAPAVVQAANIMPVFMRRPIEPILSPPTKRKWTIWPRLVLRGVNGEELASGPITEGRLSAGTPGIEYEADLSLSGVDDHVRVPKVSHVAIESADGVEHRLADGRFWFERDTRVIHGGSLFASHVVAGPVYVKASGVLIDAPAIP